MRRYRLYRNGIYYCGKACRNFSAKTPAYIYIVLLFAVNIIYQGK